MLVFYVTALRAKLGDFAKKQNHSHNRR